MSRPRAERPGRAPRTLQLTKPLRDRIRAGHPWVYDRAVAPPPRDLVPGDLVTLADAEGDIALAFVDPASPIRARILAPPGTALDDAWAASRAEAAAAQRARDPLLAGCTGRRLIHGEADACPGLVVDLYDTTAVLVFDGPAAAAFWRPRLSAVLAGLERGGAAIAHAWLRGERRKTSPAARRTDDAPPSANNRPPNANDRHPGTSERHPSANGRHPGTSERPPNANERHPGTSERPPNANERHPGTSERPPSANDRHPGTSERPPSANDRPPIANDRPPSANERPPSGNDRHPSGGEAILGDPPTSLVITEDDARFAVDVRAGQKTGFFLDQRDNRRTIRRHAAGQTVLNLFSYTGGFSLHAALGGATRVTSVDIAPPAIAQLEHNLALTSLPVSAHELVATDAFDFLARAARQQRRWDLVIADPPSFAPSERARPAALAAYRKLAAAALAVTAPSGRFALASCSSHITEADLLDQVATLAPLKLRFSAGAASDHPVLPAFPEGRYLKFLLFDV